MSLDSIIWWHFSDIHWEVTPSTERATFLNSLFEDLGRKKELFGPPDFIVIGGDLTFSGEDSQFSDFDKRFLVPVLMIAGGNDTPIFVVPGNHDLKRTSAKTVNSQLILKLASATALNEFLESDEYVEMVERPFKPFEQFARRIMPNAKRGTLSWSQRLSIRNHEIQISGVHTAWASSYYVNSDGVIDDDRHLLLGEKQLASLTMRTAPAELSLLIFHHPLSWLAGFNQSHVKHLINARADIVLFGHTHTLHDLSMTLSSTGSCVYLPSPALYDRSNVDSLEFARGYNIGLFDFSSKKGTAYYFKYSSAFATKFSPFQELYQDNSQDGFLFDLSKPVSNEDNYHKRRSPSTFMDLFEQYPGAYKIMLAIEKLVAPDSIETHTVDYFDAIILELAAEVDIGHGEDAETFWEAVVLCRGLLYFDLRQMSRSLPKAYRPHLSVDDLLACVHNSAGPNCKLPPNDYRALFSIALDSGSLTPKVPTTAFSDAYRRVWAFPWLASRLVLYCDYPELIPLALTTEGRIAALFTSQTAEQLALLSHRFDAPRFQLTLELRIQDRDGFFAVTLLKHYCDVALRNIADLWRMNQRSFPPIGITLSFPRWRNKKIFDYYLTVETTSIVKLLMGAAMYGQGAKHVWFREILQNALDASSARKTLDKLEYSPQIEVLHSGGDLCIIRDNGIGMSRQHILKYLTTLGRSIWSSDELRDGKPASRDDTIKTIGKFGIGFAAVFQDAKRVLVRTKFFRDVGESGWLVEFAGVEKPFLLEGITTDVGTEVEIELKEGLPERGFLRLVNEFFIYIDQNISFKPDPRLPRA